MDDMTGYQQLDLSFVKRQFAQALGQ